FVCIPSTLCFNGYPAHRFLHAFPTRRSSDLITFGDGEQGRVPANGELIVASYRSTGAAAGNLPANVITEPAKTPRQSIRRWPARSEEHTSELQSRRDLVCRLLLEKKKKKKKQ